MPHPREAIYDVLASKKARAVQAERDAKLAEDWERYEDDNARAHASYRPDRPIVRKVK